jgi:hypothetical protein
VFFITRRYLLRLLVAVACVACACVAALGVVFVYHVVIEPVPLHIVLEFRCQLLSRSSL